MSHERITNTVKLKGTPGTEFVTDLTYRLRNKSTGVISGVVKKAANNLADLSGLQYLDLFPATFNGVPRDNITAKAMYDGDVYLWAKYKFPSTSGRGGSDSEPLRLKIDTGHEIVTVWNSVSDPDNVGVGTSKFATPDGKRQVAAMVMTLKWNFDTNLMTEGAAMPAGAIAGMKLQSSLNKNALHLDTMEMPARSCLYMGIEMTWKDNYWTYYHNAKYREFYPAKPEPGISPVPKHWEVSFVEGIRVKWTNQYMIKDWGI